MATASISTRVGGRPPRCRTHRRSHCGSPGQPKPERCSWVSHEDTKAPRKWRENCEIPLLERFAKTWPPKPTAHPRLLRAFGPLCESFPASLKMCPAEARRRREGPRNEIRGTGIRRLRIATHPPPSESVLSLRLCVSARDIRPPAVCRRKRRKPSEKKLDEGAQEHLRHPLSRPI